MTLIIGVANAVINAISRRYFLRAKTFYALNVEPTRH